jgi:hypothetical protein
MIRKASPELGTPAEKGSSHEPRKDTLMSEVPFPIQMLQALATPAIAFLAVAIGGMQWWTSRQKLVLDLFDKRFEVFLDVRRIASEAMQLGKLERPGAVNEIIARGRFLFGDDMRQSLIKLHSLVTDLEMKQPRASFEISQHFDTMLPLFDRYLKMAQRPPQFLST